MDLQNTNIIIELLAFNKRLAVGEPVVTND